MQNKEDERNDILDFLRKEEYIESSDYDDLVDDQRKKIDKLKNKAKSLPSTDSISLFDSMTPKEKYAMYNLRFF